MKAETKLPFAAVKFFNVEKIYELDRAISLKELQRFLDSVLYKNSFSALRISGEFESIEYFCYQPQKKPYKPIEEAKKKIIVKNNVSGILVGFHTPPAAKVINSPKYHFHFINEERNSGGHVENCRIRKIRIEIDYADQLTIALPKSSQLPDIELK